MTALNSLEPVMPLLSRPQWSGARWIGTVDSSAELAEKIEVSNSDGYHIARILVRDGLRPRGFIELDITDGEISSSELIEKAFALPTSQETAPPFVDDVPITVAVCTRNRTEQLKDALASILDLDYGNFDILIVDNASEDTSTREYIRNLSTSKVDIVFEPVAGLAYARNRALMTARGDIVAFTDDDVVVDAGWLRAIASNFADRPKVGCVSGLVPSGELRTPSQSYFEQRVHWSSCLRRQVFDVASPPIGDVMFPFRVGAYGTGANFAIRRSTAIRLGGFDEGLGVGSPTGGGEDIDMFCRVIVGGSHLIYEPSAIVWHRHRDDVDALLVQARGYGLGLGAWLTKVAMSRELAPLAFKRAFAAARHLRSGIAHSDLDGSTTPPGVRRASIASTLIGPIAYSRSRIAGRRATPLLSRRDPSRQGVPE